MTHRTTIPYRWLTRAADAGRTDWSALRAEVRERAATWKDRVAMRLEDLGVELVRGDARFESEQTLRVGAQLVRFDRAIVTAGAEPATLPGVVPDGARLITADQLAGLETLPSEAMVIGGGPAGAETVDLLSRFGVRVTWVMDDLGILPSFDRELADAIGDVLMSRGVKLVHGKAVTDVQFGGAGVLAKLEGGRTYSAPLAVVAVGNRPNVEALEVSAVGARVDGYGALAVDERCRTSAPHVFAAGDVTGRSVGVAGAEAMGRVAGREAAGEAGPAFDSTRVPRFVMTRPEAAQVGLSAEETRGREVIFHTLRGEETLAGLLESTGERAERKGFVRLVCDSDDGRILGGSALGPGASEAVGAIALALELGLTDRKLAEASAVAPSALDAVVRAVR
jgi:dihydrolipoamide dehydrogenase